MSNTITDFKNGFNGGSRANRFSVDIQFPSFGENSTLNVPTTFHYHAVAAKLPEAELGSISIPYRGRVAHFAGDRDYKPWTVTILDDTGIKASWRAFHAWSNLLSAHTNNKTKDSTYKNDILLKTVKFNQLRDPAIGSDNGVVSSTHTRTITLYHAWPSEIGQIGLDMGEGGSLVTFSVTFSYDYYTIEETQQTEP